MENYKIYRQENYIKISSKQDWYGLVKDVFVDKSNVKKPEYRFFNVKDWESNIALSIGQIQKEDGSLYTEQEFDTFYRENTGNFKSPNSGAIFVEVSTLPIVDINQNTIYILPDNSWNVYNGVQWIKEDVQSIIYTEVAALPTTSIKTNIIYILPNGSWNLYNGINWLKEDVQFVVVNTYNDLPLSPTNNKWFWVSNSQGTTWLPSSLGGTYYPKGVYYYNGVNYEYIETPYQATQSEVNAGINNDKFVTPLTLKNSLPTVVTLLKEEFVFSGSQIFTLTNNYSQVYSVEVQGQGALSESQYTLVAPNQVTINDVLNTGDYVVIVYSNNVGGVTPYYTQAQTDAGFIENTPKLVFVKDVNDLPTPTSSVITLEDDTTYYITDTIDLVGNRLVGGKNTTIIGGSSEVSVLTSTGLGVGVPLLTSIYTTPIRHLSIKDVNTAISFDGTTNPNDMALDWTGVNFVNVPNVGTVKKSN